MLKTKKYLKLKKSGNSYEYAETNDDGLGTLSYFLDDCHRSVNRFKELINDSTTEKFGGNVTFLEKEGNKITIILDFLGDKERYKDAFEATIERLICIMD